MDKEARVFMNPEDLAMALKSSPDGLFIACHVQPNASRTTVVGMYGSDLKLSLKSPPVDGKANKELCRFFSETFHLPSRSAEVVSGHVSRKKRVFLRGVSLETFLKEFAS